MRLCAFCVCKFAGEEKDKDGTQRRKEEDKSCRNKAKLKGRGDSLDNETRVRMSE